MTMSIYIYITFFRREESFKRFRRNKDDENRECAKWKETNEKRCHNGGQHEDNLLPILKEVAAISLS